MSKIDIAIGATDLILESTNAVISNIEKPWAILTSLYVMGRKIQDRREIKNLGNRLSQQEITLRDILNYSQKFVTAEEYKKEKEELIRRLESANGASDRKYFSTEIIDLLIRARFGDEDAIEGLMDIQTQKEDALQFVISSNMLGVGIESLLEDRRICTPMPAGSLYFSPGKIHIMSEKGQIYRAKPHELGIALKTQNEMMKKFGREHSTLEEISLAGEVSFGVDAKTGAREKQKERTEKSEASIEKAKKAEAPKVGRIITPNSDFSLEETSDFYVFRNVLVDGINYNILWAKKLLAKGEKKTQDDWMEYCKTQKEYRGQIITLPSGLVYHASTSSLYRNRTNPKLNSGLVERVKGMFEDDFKEHWMTTSTRIRYKARPAMDKVFHDYKSLNPTIKSVNLQGSDGSISTLGCADEMDAIFGSRNLSEINAVYEWITGKDTHLLRPVNVTTDEERPLGVGVGVYFYVADYHVDGRRFARGVAVGRA